MFAQNIKLLISIPKAAEIITHYGNLLQSEVTYNSKKVP